MKPALKILAGVAAGVVVVFVLVIVVEVLSNVVHPLPADFYQPGKTPEQLHEEMCRHVENYPAWVLAVVVPAWAAIGFIGAWIARKIGGSISAIIVGLLILTALICNISMLPYPIWFKTANLIAIPVALYLGGRSRTGGGYAAE